MISDIGDYYEFLNAYFMNQPRELSFLSETWDNVEKWKATTKEKVLELLLFSPPKADLLPQTTSIKDFGDYIQEEVTFNVSSILRISGSVLIPKNGAEKHPAVVALHDHGAFFYFGREKIINTSKDSAILDDFKQRYYGGRSWASDLVAKGFLVLIIDAFMFGERKLNYDAVSEDIKERFSSLEGIDKNDDSYILAFNKTAKEFEQLIIRHIFGAGATWAGIIAHDDRASVDYLVSRDDVDISRIGCCGLSLGGFRAALLSALDSRIKCSVVTGWMPTLHSLLRNHFRNHTFMVYIPGLTKYMELPDLVGLAVPNHLFVQQCARDELYTLEGMQESCEIIQKIYTKAGCPSHFKSKFYDVPHLFNQEMQEDAFLWLCQNLHDGR